MTLNRGTPVRCRKLPAMFPSLILNSLGHGNQMKFHETFRNHDKSWTSGETRKYLFFNFEAFAYETPTILAKDFLARGTRIQRWSERKLAGEEHYACEKGSHMHLASCHIYIYIYIYCVKCSPAFVLAFLRWSAA